MKYRCVYACAHPRTDMIEPIEPVECRGRGCAICISSQIHKEEHGEVMDKLWELNPDESA